MFYACHWHPYVNSVLTARDSDIHIFQCRSVTYLNIVKCRGTYFHLQLGLAYGHVIMRKCVEAERMWTLLCWSLCQAVSTSWRINFLVSVSCLDAFQLSQNRLSISTVSTLGLIMCFLNKECQHSVCDSIFLVVDWGVTIADFHIIIMAKRVHNNNIYTIQVLSIQRCFGQWITIRMQL